MTNTSFSLLEEAYLLVKQNHQEQNLINEANALLAKYDRNRLNESIADIARNKFASWFQKVEQFTANAKVFSSSLVEKVWSMVQFVLEKLSLDKKSFAERHITKIGNQLVNTIQAGLDKENIGNAVKRSLDSAKSEGLIDEENIEESFKTNKDAIFLKIKEQIANELEELKHDIQEDLESFDTEDQQPFVKTIVKNTIKFGSGMSFMAAFGLIDNLGLFLGMSAVEDWIISIGFDSLVAAGIGNTFSDVVGLLSGQVVSRILLKYLKLEGEGTFLQQLVGLVSGCLLPVVARIMWITLVGN